jgi:hypothetical protein
MWSQAKMEKARKLLALHADFNTDPFSSLDELLRKMPVYNSGTKRNKFLPFNKTRDQ